MTTTIQDHFLLEIHHSPFSFFTSPLAISEHWPKGCVAIAFVWNMLAQKEGMCRGATLIDRPGYAGTVWIGTGGEWNRSTTFHHDPWNGWIPINDILALLRKGLP